MDQHLQVFLTVVEEKNFSRAAEKLHMTQPAVSQYIKTFERNIGTSLLDRTNKYVRMNKAGEMVYHHAKEIVGIYSKMERLLDELKNQASGSLSIGASYTYGEYVLPGVIAQMQKHYPQVLPSVTIGNTTEIADKVMVHELDVGIVEGHLKHDQQLQVEEFAEDQMVVVAQAGYGYTSNRRSISLAELEGKRWLLREEGSGTREAAETVFDKLLISPADRLYFGSTQSIKGAIEAGLGISLLSKWAVQKELDRGELEIIEAEGMPFIRQFSIVTASPYQTKTLQEFIKLAKFKKNG